MYHSTVLVSGPKGESQGGSAGAEDKDVGKGTFFNATAPTNERPLIQWPHGPTWDPPGIPKSSLVSVTIILFPMNEWPFRGAHIKTHPLDERYHEVPIQCP